MKFLRHFVPLACALLSTAALAQSGHGHQHGAMPDAAPPPANVRPVFIASTAKSFAALMIDAMAVMDDGMRRAPMSGNAEHDFVTMMIPHHQGAIDMAKALLLRTTDPAMRNLAQGILAEQQIEIQRMQQWLKEHPTAATANIETARKITP